MLAARQYLEARTSYLHQLEPVPDASRLLRHPPPQTKNSFHADSDAALVNFDVPPQLGRPTGT